MHILLILALISMAVSIFGSIVGVGGGFLLMPVLMLMYPAETPERLTFISLFAVFTNGATAFLNYVRIGRIDYKSGLIMGLCTVPTAVLARLVQEHISHESFRPFFGGFLIAIGVFILWRVITSRHSHSHIHAKSKPHWFKRNITDGDGMNFAWSYDLRIGVVVGLLVGFIGAFFGIGGGVLQMPVLTQVLNFPPLIAAPTTLLLVTLNSLGGIATDLIRDFHKVPFALAGVAGLGAFFGAQIGTRLARRISGKRLLYLLAAALLVAGARLTFERSKHHVAAPPEQIAEDPVTKQ